MPRGSGARDRARVQRERVGARKLPRPRPRDDPPIVRRRRAGRGASRPGGDSRHAGGRPRLYFAHRRDRVAPRARGLRAARDGKGGAPRPRPVAGARVSPAGHPRPAYNRRRPDRHAADPRARVRPRRRHADSARRDRRGDDPRLEAAEKRLDARNRYQARGGKFLSGAGNEERGMTPNGPDKAVIPRPPLASYLLLFLPPVFWSSNFIVGKALVGKVPAWTLNAGRFAVPTLILLPLLVYHQASSPRKTLLPLLLMSLTGVFAFNAVLYIGLRYTSAINATLVNATTPITTTLIARLLIREEITRRRVVGIALSFAGIGWIVRRGAPAALAGLRSKHLGVTSVPA